MKKCPNCAKHIQDEANKCPYCGEWKLLLSTSETLVDFVKNLDNDSRNEILPTQKKEVMDSKNKTSSDLTNFFMCVFTGLMVFVGILTYKIMCKQDETSRMRDRAFLYFTDIKTKQYPTNNPLNISFIFKIENSGNMPARRLSIVYACPDVESGERIPDFLTNYFTPVQVPDVIGPKQSLSFYGCVYALSEVEKFKLDKRRLSIFLEAIYLDGFDNSIRVTQMSRFVQFDSEGEMIFAFGPSPHNCTDEDCPKDDLITRVNRQKNIDRLMDAKLENVNIKKLQENLLIEGTRTMAR